MSAEGGYSATFEDYLKEKERFAEEKIKKSNDELKAANFREEILKDDLALEKSIGKWYAIFNGVGVDNGGRNCALCLLYKKHGVYMCGGCIVAETAYSNGCNKTPYVKWIGHHDEVHHDIPQNNGRKVECPVCVELALKELNFLKSLRKPEKPTSISSEAVDWAQAALRRRPFTTSLHSTY